MKRVFWMTVVLLLTVALVLGADSIMDRVSDNQLRAQAEAMRDEVRTTRAELERCLDEMDELERAFRAQERTTETLRARVEEFEAMDERGVPQDRYDEYLETVDRFNESLPEWERLGEEYRETAEVCRHMARTHNAQADSLGTFLVQEGLMEDTWSPDAPDATQPLVEEHPRPDPGSHPDPDDTPDPDPDMGG